MTLDPSSRGDSPDPEQRIAGVLAPVYALREAGDLGIGDTHALVTFIDWAADHGFALVKFLPVNETGPDNSPYNAISSVALDPLLLRLSPQALPDLSEADFAAVLAEYGDGSADTLSPARVDYERVRPRKLALLNRAYARFETLQGEVDADAARLTDFDAFCAASAEWLEPFALFRALMEANGESQVWSAWHEEQRSPQAAQAWRHALPGERRPAFERRLRFFKYVQWQAQRQWRVVHRHARARGVLLMGDIPIGVSRDSADVWGERNLFRTDWSAGTPPDGVFEHDPFTSKWGQNWGIPLYDWEAMHGEGLRWWRRRVAVAREYLDLIRIDHILGFYRIYGFPWQPERNSDFLHLAIEEASKLLGGLMPRFHPASDETDEDAASNRDNGARLLAAIVEEAGPHRLIGEDLGVVPHYVRASLAALEIAGYRIPQWEFGADKRVVPGRDYARLSLATYGTHDHEPLALLWQRATAGGTHPGAPGYRDYAALCDFAGLDPAASGSYTQQVHEALLRALFNCNSWIAVLQFGDVFGWHERTNLPGTTGEANWRTRFRLPLAQVEGEGLAARVRELIRQSGRAVPPRTSPARVVEGQPHS